MAKRICDVCGKNKDLEGGKTCEKGHFVCRSCVDIGMIGYKSRDVCPICKTKLR